MNKCRWHLRRGKDFGLLIFIRDIYRYWTIYSLSTFVSLILLIWAYILAQFFEVGIVFFSYIFCTVFILLFYCFCCFFCFCCFCCCWLFSKQGAIKSRKYFKTDNFLPKRFLQVTQFFYEIVEKKRGSYDTLTYTYIWSENIVHMNLSYELTEHIKRKNSLSHFDGQRQQWHDPCHCWLLSWPFNVNQCDVTDTLLSLLLWCCEGKFSIYATHWMIVLQNTEIYITLENSQNISNRSPSHTASTISKTVKSIRAQDENSRTFSAARLLAVDFVNFKF